MFCFAGFGFGASTSTTGTGTGFGTGFGTSTGTTGFGTTGFGTGSTLGGTSTGFSLGGGLGGGAGTGTGPANAQQAAAGDLANTAAAVSLPLIFGDERDALIAKWNQLQAFWGTGKGFYNQQGQAVEFKNDNPFCRFKVYKL